MGDIINEDEMGQSPSLGPSRYERMHEQYNNFVEEEEHWQDVSRLHYNCPASAYICNSVKSPVPCDRNWLAGRIAVAVPHRSLSGKRKRGRGWRKG